MPVWYPSKKMQCIIKAESAKVEFAFLLQTEHDDDVLEVWDQPPPMPLEYPDKRGRLQRPMHTADYFVFRYRECGWIECKPAQELLKQAEKGPHRYVLDEQGNWRCPPGEAFAAKYGLTYRVWSSDEINWAVQDNTLYLEDYYQGATRNSTQTLPEAKEGTLVGFRSSPKDLMATGVAFGGATEGEKAAWIMWTRGASTRSSLGLLAKDETG